MSDRQRQFLWFAAAWAFPLALWLIATAWFGFDLGKYSDDWAISLRTPESDAYQWPASPFIRWHYFWRPAHLLTVYSLATAFWHHDRVNHAISALAHLGVGLLMLRLLLRTGIGQVAARCALCIFLVVPVSLEAVLWPAALGSVVGVGWFLLIATMLIRSQCAGSPRPGARHLAGLAVMGFLTACWHEQPAACVLALPALFLAVRRDSGLVALRRAMAPTAACAAGVAAYIALFVATVPPGRRGGSNTLIGAHAIGARLSRLCEMAWNLSLGPRAQDSTRDAWKIGGRVIRESPGSTGWAVLAVAIGLGICWLAAQARTSRAAHESRPRCHRGGLALFGIGLAVTSILPIALVSTQPMQARYLYGAGAGLAIALAAALDAILSQAPATRGRATLAGGFAFIVASAAICASVCCIGWQDQFRQRSLADDDQMAQLRRLVPDPPKDAAFVPLELADGRLSFLKPHDPGVMGALAAPWSCWAYVQRGYGRSDLSATHLRPGLRPPASADSAGIHYPRGLCDAWGLANPDRTLIPWDKAIVFAVDGQGAVRLVTREEAMKRLGGTPDSGE